MLGIATFTVLWSYRYCTGTVQVPGTLCVAHVDSVPREMYAPLHTALCTTGMYVLPLAADCRDLRLFFEMPSSMMIEMMMLCACADGLFF